MPSNNDLVFYLEEDEVPEVASPRENVKNHQPEKIAEQPNNALEATLSWEESLQSLRKLRTHESPPGKSASIAGFINRNHEPITAVGAEQPLEIQELETSKVESAVIKPEVVLKQEQKKAVYENYLDSWQEQHNLNKSSQDEVELLFTEDWFSAQDDVLLSNDEVEIQAEQVVLLKENTVVDDVEVFQAASLDEEELTEQVAAVEDDFQIVNVDQTALQKEDMLAVNLQVIAPKAGEKRVICLSEAALVERLTQQLEVHLSNIIGGTLKTIVQKHTSLLLKQAEESLVEEIPNLVNEVIEHNINDILLDIKNKQS